MHVDVHDVAIGEVFAPDATLTRVVDGLQFGEGPVWDKRRKCLYFVDNIASKLCKWTQGVGVETVVSPTGHANGATLDREGRVIVAGWSSRTVWRLEHDGTLATLASHFEGRKLNTPNDVIMRSDGSIYFTDSDGGLFIPAMDGEDLQRYLDFSGVYRISPDGKGLQLVVRDLAFPNGLAFSPDERLLYVSDTWQKDIWVYEVQADGSVHNGRQFYKLHGHEPGHADGLKVDTRGNVYSTGPLGVHVVSPHGKLLARLKIPEECTNMAWGGDDWCTLFITTFHSVFRTRALISGIEVW
jgi:gluconolactonase